MCYTHILLVMHITCAQTPDACTDLHHRGDVCDSLEHDLYNIVVQPIAIVMDDPFLLGLVYACRA